ncbi:MAG: hypothetical protein GXY33_02505 [Phycisphaerae bacterium]|nr:hypothetical protein [Phycisphaerae bacterium]
MKIVLAEKVYDAGRYHAWTDLAVFKGKYYLAFRTGAMHTSGDGVAEILQSPDGLRWTHCAKGVFKYGDECSPLLAATPDRLYMFLHCTWFDPETCAHKTQPLMFHTDNGDWWSGPFPYLPKGYQIWRPKYHSGCFYATGYRQTGETEGGSRSDLFSSCDGRKWELIHSIGEVHPRTNETELAFAPDGEMVALIRCEAGRPEQGKDNPACSYLGRAKSPYRQWRYTQGPFVGGPLLVWWKGQLLAIGRTYLNPDQRIAPWDTTDRTMVCRVVGDRLERRLILPGGGDSSYAGAVELPNGNLLVSYYSSQEFAADPKTRLRRSAIYLAEIEP